MTSKQSISKKYMQKYLKVHISPLSSEYDVIVDWAQKYRNLVCVKKNRKKCTCSNFQAFYLF